MKIATLTTTRGDRPQFFEFAKVQMDLQTVDIDFRYYIGYTPESSEPDLTQRFRKGIDLAKGTEFHNNGPGSEKIFIYRRSRSPFHCQGLCDQNPGAKDTDQFFNKGFWYASTC